jgi:hypothetical protein
MGKPTVKLTGTDGNVFSLLGACTRALRKAGMTVEATALTDDVMGAGSYDEALQMMMRAVDVT